MTNAYSQKVDSLVALLNKSSKDTTRVLLLNQLSSDYREVDSNIALRYAEEGEVLADSLGYKKGIAAILENIGWIYYRKGILSKAYRKSIDALKINQDLGIKKGIAQCLNNIGAINIEQRLYENAIINFKEAYQNASAVGFTSAKGRSLNNIAFCFLKLKKMDSSRHYANRSIVERVNDKFRAAFSQRILGEISFGEGNYSEALRYYQITLDAADEGNNNFLRASTLFRVGDTYIEMGKPDLALPHLQRNIVLAKRFGYNGELESTYQILIKAYSAKNNFTEAFKVQEKYIQLHDSLATFKNDEQLAIMQAEYNDNLKNARIELLTKDSLLKQSSIITQRNLIYVVSGSLIILIALMIALVKANRNSNELNTILTNQNHLIIDQKNQLESLNETKDKLFSIIGHDLRSPLNSLRGLMDLVDNAALTKEEFITHSKKLKANIDVVSSDLANLLSWAQTQQKGFAANMGDVNIKKLVTDKIELYAELTKAKGLQIFNEVDPTIIVWADNNHISLILRNLIGNAIKFSKENTDIKVSSLVVNDRVEVSISDKGIGMTSEEISNLFKIGLNISKLGTKSEEGIGLGLHLVKEFVELNKGSLRVASEPGVGSSFTFSLKLKSVKGLSIAV